MISVGTRTTDSLLQQLVSSQERISTDLSAMRADVARALTRIELLEQHDKTSDRQLGDQESRIRLLERFRYMVMGAAVVVGGVAGYLASFVHSAAH